MKGIVEYCISTYVIQRHGTMQVKKLQAEDHYEMREYSIDILDEDGGSNPHAERRPYPLYPAKAGLKPGFLRDIISRYLLLFFF